MFYGAFAYMTVAGYIIDFLKSKGVRTVFAYPGANVLRLYGLLCQSGIRVILTRHEQGAAHAAAGYAKATGKPGVCIATSGPGAANLVTGIADAYLDSAPMLIITGQVPSAYIGRDAFQEADIMGMTIPVSKHNYLIRHQSEVPRDLEEAWRIAVCPRQGPVLVDITSDLFDSALTEQDMRFECLLPRERHNRYPLDSVKEKTFEALRASFRPVILAGGGVYAAGASALLEKAAAESHIPVVFTMMGKSAAAAPGSQCRYLGMTGRHGNAKANRALSQSDLVIAVGCRFSDRTVGDFAAFGRSRTVIHCDIDPAELDKNVKADIPVCCDAGSFLSFLTEICSTLPESVLGRFDNWGRALFSNAMPDLQLAPYDTDAGDSNQVYSAVAEYVAKYPSSAVVTDVGCVQTKTAREVPIFRERGFITSGGLGVMGFGLPGAIGAAFGLRDFGNTDSHTRVIALCGDGGFQMTVQECGLLGKCPVPVKVIIVNNSCLKMVKDMPAGAGGYYDMSDNPDFVHLAESYGISGVRAVSGSCREAVSEFLNSDAAGVLEIKED